MFWGISPALDLLTNFKLHNSLEGKTELNILVAGSADIRHVLMTISKYYTHKDAQNITINFYIVDVLLEFVARELLLILIALEPTEKIGLKEKADLWMEVFGNSMLRPTSAEFVIKKSYQFIKMITNKDYQLRRMPCINIDNLKYKEKDSLEIIFKFWIQNKYNMATNWDDRVRKYLGTRYDSRMGVFDWDYYMYIHDLPNGDLVNVREYKQWRSTGVAFTWLEKEFSISNATLAVGIDDVGDQLISFKYAGDITSGPFYCFGTQCEDKDMLKKVNQMRAKRATDITERNLMRMFYEIEHNEKYIHKGEVRDLGVTVTEMIKLKFEDDSNLIVDYSMDEDDYTALPIKHRIIFLPVNTLEDKAKLEKYHHFFDLMHIGNNLINLLNSTILAMVKENGIILMETMKFKITKADKKEFENNVLSLMKESNCEQIGKCDFKKDEYCTFRVNIKKDAPDKGDQSEKENNKQEKHNDVKTEEINNGNEQTHLNEEIKINVETNGTENGKEINATENKEQSQLSISEENELAAENVLEGQKGEEIITPEMKQKEKKINTTQKNITEEEFQESLEVYSATNEKNESEKKNVLECLTVPGINSVEIKQKEEKINTTKENKIEAEFTK